MGDGGTPPFYTGGGLHIDPPHTHTQTPTHTHTLFTVTSPPAELGFVSRYQIIANFGTSIFKVFAGRAPTPPAKRFAASALTCRGLPLAKFQDLETLSYHYLYMVSSDTQGSAGGGVKLPPHFSPFLAYLLDFPNINSCDNFKDLKDILRSYNFTCRCGSCFACTFM